MSNLFKTTTGSVRWDEHANGVESVDDPDPPDGDLRWRLVGSTISELRFSHQTIFWFWQKIVSNTA